MKVDEFSKRCEELHLGKAYILNVSHSSEEKLFGTGL